MGATQSLRDTSARHSSAKTGALENTGLMHPLFPAFEQAEYGSLIIRAPDGQAYRFDGRRPGVEAYIRLHSWHGLDALLNRGEIGFAESYAKQEWDTTDLPALIMYGIINTDSLERYFYGSSWYSLWQRLRTMWASNSLSGSRNNIQKHYDLGNDFYALWLDESMTYSCALFKGDSQMSLEEAQAAKYRRILTRLAPYRGAHILDIGCGWGGFEEFAAREGFRVTGVTVSAAQKAYADERMHRQKLDHLVRIDLKDYRQIEGQFDYIVSIGMFEHVGEHYWPAYFQTLASLLSPKGKAMMQSIVLDEKIFSGSCLPSQTRFAECLTKAGLTCREKYTFGKDYALTLKAWLHRFEKWLPEIRMMGYDDYFIRLWRFYLASCIASFTVGRTNVMQVEIGRAPR